MTSPVNRTVIATRADVGVRLDLVLCRHLADVDVASRTRVQTWIAAGAVAVNGRTVHRSAARAALGDVIGLSLPESASRASSDAGRPDTHMGAEAIPLDILFEDDLFIAVNKPAGLVVHPTYRHRSGTLMNALLWHARPWTHPQRPSLVGRLDKLTSGIVLAAKTAPVHAALQRAIASAGQKDYLAAVYGPVTVARGQIDLRLARDRTDRRRVVASADGSPSVTRFKRLARAPGRRGGLALLRCRLMTGRMHQIRVHLAARGWPIVGDPIYGEARWSRVTDLLLAAVLRDFPRQALHAWRLAFPHPLTGRPVRIEAPLPPDLDSLLQLFGLSSGYLNLYNRSFGLVPTPDEGTASAGKVSAS